MIRMMRAAAWSLGRRQVSLGFAAVCMLAAVLAAPAAQAQWTNTGAVENGSFEADGLPGVWPFYTGTITGWNLSGGGHMINSDASGPFHDVASNGSVPDGTYVSGIQRAGTTEQNIAGLIDGRPYRLDLYVNERNDPGVLDLRIRMGTQVIYGPTTFTATNPYQFLQITFVYSAAWGNNLILESLNDTADSTILLDDVRLYVANNYSVGYNSIPGSGGSTTGPNNINHTGTPNSSITVTAAANTGYTRSGVPTSTNGTVVAAGGNNFTLSGVTANTTVTGNFTPNTYTVSFDSQGGSPVANKNVTFNAPYGALTSPTRTGYTFNGWFTLPAGGTPVTAATTVTTPNNHPVFAQWTVNNYTVTFNAQGGTTPVPASKSVTFNNSYGALATTSRTGYTFNGWFTASTGGTQVLSGTTVTTAANHTLFAQWTPNTYTVSFNSQGGSVVGNKVVTFDTAYGALTTPTRTGYTFNGWFDASTGGTVVTAVSTVNTASNHTLFAQWTPNTYTVTFDAQGGTAAAPPTKVVTFDATYGALATTTRAGFSLDGWFTLASGGTQVTAATFVTATSNHTLFARWTDVEDPVANCANPTVQLDAAGSVTVTVAEIDGGSTDNDAITVRTIDGGATVVFSCADVGNQSVVLRVEDAAGNFDTCTATVTVEDSVAPTALCQSVTRNLSVGGTVTGADVDNGSSDACGIASVALQGGDIAATCANLGTQSVTLVVTDNNGNTATCATATVTIVDDVAPVLTPVAGPTATVVVGSTFTDPGATASDNCGVSATPVATLIAGTVDTSTAGNTWTIEYTVSDGAGNPATAVQTVFTVSADTVAPVISGAGTDITVSCGTTLTNSAALAGVTANDDVDGPVTVTVDLSGLPALLVPSGSPYVIPYSASDAATNVAMVNRNIVVLDDCTLAVTPVGSTNIPVEDGADVTLEVSVTGAVGTPVLQWYFDDGVSTPQLIPGASAAIYIFTVDANSYGEYYCEVTDDVTMVTSSPSFTVVSASALPVGGALGLTLLTIMSAVGGASALRKRK